MDQSAIENHKAAVAAARSQYGVVSRSQLLSIGWSNVMIRNQLAAQRWNRLLPGVYATATGEPSIETWMWAAVLYCGDGAVLASWSALQAHGIEAAALPIHVAVPAYRKVDEQSPFVELKRWRLIRPSRAVQSLPQTTTAAHALVDATDTLRRTDRVIALVTKAMQRDKVSASQLAAVVSQRRRIRHRALLKILIAQARDGATSALEIPAVGRILKAHGLPPGRGQVREQQSGKVVLRDRVIDPYGLVLEFDGRLGHSDPDGRFRDHRRDNAVIASGRRVLRFGWNDVHDEACSAAAQVSLVLRALGWRGELTKCSPLCAAKAPQGGTFRP